MRRSGGENLDQALLGHLRVSSGNIPVIPLELIQPIAVPLHPSLGKVDHVAVVQFLKVGAIRLGALDAVLEISLKAVAEMLMGQLLQQNRRQAHDQLRVTLEETTLFEHGQNRQVGLGRRFVKPVLAMGPDTVSQDIG